MAAVSLLLLPVKLPQGADGLSGIYNGLRCGVEPGHLKGPMFSRLSGCVGSVLCLTCLF